MRLHLFSALLIFYQATFSLGLPNVSQESGSGDEDVGGVKQRTELSVPEELAANVSLPFLVEEIEEVEQLISLQNRKLVLLRALRYRALAGEKLDAATAQQLQRALSTDTPGLLQHGNRSGEGGTPEWSKHLTNEMQLELNYAIVASVVMVAKVKRMPGQHGSEVLLGLVDSEGYLHIITTQGEEVLLYHLGHSHSISTIAFDGTDVKKTIFVSAATDGSVHIMSMEVTRNTSLSADKTVAVTMSVLFRYKLNEVIPALIEREGSAPVNASAAYVTSLLVYVKQSVKSFVLLVGDSVGRVTLCSLLGESFDVNIIRPGEPVVSMTRLGTLVAIAAGHNIHIHVMGRFELPAKICRSGGVKEEDKISQISMDMGSNPYLFAKTIGGKVLSFDTKSRGKNELSGKPDVFCVLLSSVNLEATSTRKDHTKSSENEVAVYGSILALKGTVMFGHNCDLKLYDTQHLKSSGELSLMDTVHALDNHSTGLSGCELATSGGGSAQRLSAGLPRAGVYFDSAFLPPKSERSRAVDAFVLATANWKSDTLVGNNCSDTPDTCSASSQPYRARLQLYRTVDRFTPALENPLGGLFKDMGGWVRIPLFIIAFLFVFLWNGGTAMFQRKKSKKSRYGLNEMVDQDDDDSSSISPNDKSKYFNKPAYNLSASKYSNSRTKEKTVNELRDVTSELQRLQKMTESLRQKQSPLEERHMFEEDH